MKEQNSKIDVKEVLLKSLEFYKKNFKYLIVFSSIYVANEAFWIVLEFVYEAFSRQHTSYVLLIQMGSWIFLMLIWAIIMIIFGPRFLLSIFVKIKAAMNGRMISLEQAYRETKGKYWIAFGCILFLFIVNELPLLILITLNHYFSEVLLASLYVALINSLFYLLLPLIALSKVEEISYIGSSISLIKGNYQEIFKLYLLTTTLLFFSYSLASMVSTSMAYNVVLSMMYIILLFFIFPFSQVVVVVVYKKLTGETSSDEI